MLLLLGHMSSKRYQRFFLSEFRINEMLLFKEIVVYFLGGAVVKNPSASAGDTGLSPGPGRSHMPQSN